MQWYSSDKASRGQQVNRFIQDSPHAMRSYVYRWKWPHEKMTHEEGPEHCESIMQEWTSGSRGFQTFQTIRCRLMLMVPLREMLNLM